MAKSLPESGFARNEIFCQMSEARKYDADWRHSRTFSAVYYAGDDILSIADEAYLMFLSENAGQTHLFPSISRFESEVIDMTLGLLNGGDGAVGNMTSGGTESIFLAVKTARDWARSNRPRVKLPEIVAPRTAHPAFNKAAHYLGMKVIRVPEAFNFRANVQAMSAAITQNTVLIVGSAPTWPHGVFDPITGLGQLAIDNGLLFHVDSCVGGFLAPFVKKLGYPIPQFDFSVPGVTSISADLHKYGFCPKGASTILYRNPEIYGHQWFDFNEWPRGQYTGPAFTGSRTGGAIAAAWAVMNYLGQDGYLKLTQNILNTTSLYVNGIRNIEDLYILVDPDLSIITVGAKDFDIHATTEGMLNRNWFPGRLKEPPGMHLVITPGHQTVVEEFLNDLAYVVKQVKAGKITGNDNPVTYSTYTNHTS